MHTVKTLFNQRSGTSKRMKVAPNLWVGSVGDDETSAPVEDWSAYADNLFVYLLGLAMVGATPISPTPTTTESLATDTVDYVQFPWDLAWRYHTRAVQCAKRYRETAVWQLSAAWICKSELNGRRSLPTLMIALER